MDELLTNRLFPCGPVTVIPSLYFWRSIDAAWMPDEDVRVAVPDNLIRLFQYAAEGSGTHLKFLSFVFNQKWFRADQHQEKWMTFSRDRMLMIKSLEMAGRLIRITEEDIDPSVASAFRDAFGNRYEIELSPRRNFLREFFTRALSFSVSVASGAS